MKLLRFLALPVVFAAALNAALLPETIANWKRGETREAPALDVKIWAEYGLQASEHAEYADGGRNFSIDAWRFGDSTGALAAFQQLRPDDARPAKLMGVSAETPKQTLVAAGNYLFTFNGYSIKPEELSHVVATVPKYEHSPLPTLPTYLPEGAVANSERYITGPESLARFAPGVPPAVAGFRFAAEGESARFGPAGRQTNLVIFSYPTMEMARDRAAAFGQLKGAAVKRTGPLVAVALNAPSADEAERLLSRIRYQATVTVHEPPPNPKANAGTLMLNIFLLCLVLAGFCIVSGVIVGGLRILFRRSGDSGEGDDMIRLKITRPGPTALS